MKGGPAPRRLFAPAFEPTGLVLAYLEPTVDRPPVLVANGTIDLSTDEQFATALAESVERNTELVLDLRGVGFINTRGLMLLDDVGLEFNNMHARAALAAGMQLLRLCRVLRIDRNIPGFRSIDSACAAVRQY
ncbi:hypothetical protein FOS14_12105 [Skermania sp. ID1734]|uniref:STAS domain-containing protein n=1 Tax=Skermania sp. ID1734 TaxID=2597516 RepID=UPI00117E51A7|nr:STAS domain-containing protein [Skermania sp. ID1734]TSD99513.1 hypothetical protein FOS14_12105 [Skermania sp. ID1734]